MSKEQRLRDSGLRQQVTYLSAVRVFPRGTDGGVLEVRWRSTGTERLEMCQIRKLPLLAWYNRIKPSGEVF